jgi:hypothetical protein
MRRVAPELDSLMWTLVEENNPRAVDQFLARHPELTGELERRTRMVKGLKQMKPESKAHISPPPPFKPRERMQPTFSRGALIAVGVLVLAALGIASFTASYFLMPTKQPQQPVETVQATSDQTQFQKEEVVPKVETPPIGPQAGDVKPEVAIQRSNQPMSIKIEQAPLSAVLKAIGAQSGLSVILAPGMQKDPTIEVNYEQMGAVAILEDLGKQHGFTAFDQGDGSVIIVPATEAGVEDRDVDTRSTKIDPRRVGG